MNTQPAVGQQVGQQVGLGHEWDDYNKVISTIPSRQGASMAAGAVHGAPAGFRRRFAPCHGQAAIPVGRAGIDLCNDHDAVLPDAG